jgi:hypothetical protein
VWWWWAGVWGRLGLGLLDAVVWCGFVCVCLAVKELTIGTLCFNIYLCTFSEEAAAAGGASTRAQ